MIGREEGTIHELEVVCVGGWDDGLQIVSVDKRSVGAGQLKREDLPRIAEMSMDDGSMLYKPAEAGYEEALAILERAW